MGTGKKFFSSITLSMGSNVVSVVHQIYQINIFSLYLLVIFYDAKNIIL